MGYRRQVEVYSPILEELTDAVNLGRHHSHTHSNEGGEVVVIWVKENTVVAIPTVKDSLLSATGYGTCLMKWALCVVSFSCGMEVECLEIHCLPGFAIFLSAYHQVVAPGHWFTH